MVMIMKFICVLIFSNNIHEAGAFNLAKLTRLTNLNIGRNRLGHARTLTKLTNLTNLDIGGNHLGDAGAIVLTSLINLSTIYNPIL